MFLLKKLIIQKVPGHQSKFIYLFSEICRGYIKFGRGCESQFQKCSYGVNTFNDCPKYQIIFKFVETMSLNASKFCGIGARRSGLIFLTRTVFIFNMKYMLFCQNLN